MASPRPRAVATLAYSVVAYASFLATTAWAATFLADRQLPRGIDHGARPSAVVAVAVDLLVLLLFAVQHTVMARAGFKAWLTRRLPAGLERSTYVLAASLVLALAFWAWRPIGGQVWDLHGAAATAVWAVFAAGWLIAISSTFMIDHLDFLGLRGAHRHATGRPQVPPPFRERWLFAWVRHPLMLGLVLTFWATPRMTGGHLLFALASTGYIAVGVQFEERALRAELGDVYRDYADRVPAIIPRRRPRPVSG
jgi:protein-S-isoprenylcysteine O-methyltransferase Ste14